MNRAGLMVVAGALILAVAFPGQPASAAQEDRAAVVLAANLVDASIAGAPIFSEAARGEGQLDAMLADRDVQVIDIGKRMDRDESEMLAGLMNGSKILHQNVVMLRGAVEMEPALADFLSRHDVRMDEIVAMSFGEDSAEPVTVYTFDEL